MMSISRCTWILDKEGNARKFDQAYQTDLVEDVIGPMACDGLRTICVAYKDIIPSTTFIL